MADTARTLAALQALFADNTAGDISAQDLRDFLVSTYQPQGFAGGRLTLETGVPVSTTDQTGKSTLYYTPYAHNLVGLYDGASWKLYAFSEVSLALSGLTSGKNYDVWLYDNSGTLTLELLAWTNDTTRATALATQDGVYVKTGATTRRYVGTVRTTGTTTAEDSQAKRFVWNAANRVPRKLFRKDATASWTYATASFRQANAAAANQVECVVGVAGPAVDLTVKEFFETNGSADAFVAIGQDSTTTPSGDAEGYHYGPNGSYVLLTCREVFHPAAGYHYFAWLEKPGAAVTVTFHGGADSGLMGVVDA